MTNNESATGKPEVDDFALINSIGFITTKSIIIDQKLIISSAFQSSYSASH